MNIRISHKEKSIKDFLLEINSLKKYIEKLESQIRELKARNGELNKRNISLIEVEHINEKLFQDKKSLKNNIESLEKEIINTIKEKNAEIRVYEKKLDNEIIFYKGLRDTSLAKIDAAENIIKLNSIQHNYILKIEKELEDLKNQNDINMRKLKFEHENNYKILKKKMIDFIIKSQKEKEQKNTSNIEYHSKFNMILKNQILNELEHQCIQINELIKEKEKQDKKIYALTQEIIIHNSIEKILKNKNFKYEKIINNFIKNKNKEKSEIKKESKELCENKDNNNEKEKKLYRVYNSEKNIKKNFHCESDGYIFKTSMNKKEFKDYISLEKAYKQSLKNYQILKDQFNTLKDKEKLFQKRYYGIIQLYKTALEDLTQDEELIQKKIYINLNDINKGNYESLTKEEKIKIVQLLIKHLLPLITGQNNDISNLRKEFNNFDIKLTSENSTPFLRFVDNSRNKTENIYFNNKRNMTEVSNIKKNLKNNFIPNFDKNMGKKINNIYYNNNGSNSLRSSIWGINFSNNNLIKNKEDISNYNKTNGFLYSSKSSVRNQKGKRKNSEIRLIKRGIFGERIQNGKSPLLRFMFFQNIKNENNRNNVNNVIVDKNFSS